MQGPPLAEMVLAAVQAPGPLMQFESRVSGLGFAVSAFETCVKALYESYMFG